MKPIVLKMTAFGPYKDTEVIDFTKLGDHRLFVISGMTGAGKTTIFDGISFALYGSGSGQDRQDIKSLRSDFADDTVQTAAELIFEIHGRTYRVLRQLGHVKAGNKSATGEKYELYEILIDGTEKPAIERMKVREVDSKIEEILGLTQDQFSQIVMLPQGEFRKLLTSETENKEEILRKIFKTDRYGEVIKKLDVKRRNAELEQAQVEAVRKSYIGQISGALPERKSHLFEVVQNKAVNMHQLLEALNEEANYYTAQITEQQKDYDVSFKLHGEKQVAYIEAKSKNEQLAEQQKRQQQLAELELQRSSYEEQKEELEAAERASRLEPFEQQLEVLHREFAVKESALMSAQQALEHAQLEQQQAAVQLEGERVKGPEREAASSQVLQLAALEPVFKELEDKRRIVAQLTRETEATRIEMEQIVTKREASSANLRTALQAIEVGETQLVSFDKLSTRLDVLREKMKIFNELEKHKPEVIQLEENLKRAQEKKQQAEQLYKIEEQKWITNQASVLVSKLVDGEPCPVCGSTTHARLQEVSGEAVDEKVLDKLKNNVALVELHYMKLYGEFTAANQHEIRLNESLKSLGTVAEQHAVVKDEYMKIGQQVQSLKKVKEQVVAQRAQWRKEQAVFEQLEQQSSEAVQTYNGKKLQLAQEQAILEEKQKMVSTQFETLQQLQQAIQSAQQLKNQLERQWENSQQQAVNANQQLASSELQVKHCETSKNEVIEKLETVNKQFNELLTAAHFESFEAYVVAKRTEGYRSQLNADYLKYIQNIHAIQSKILDAAEKLVGVVWQDLEETEQQLTLLKVAYEEAYRKLNQSIEYARLSKEFYEKLEVTSKEIASLEEKAGSIIELYNVLRGQNERKISFERYVQIGYLEQITYAANRRLKFMSDGQYSLHCSNRQESHGRQSGLSLDVFDGFTGQMRDVKSLSGGEKFNASLCLALGMADVIQSFQGNIRIDTMFIDEGFGSLDQETLLKAIDTLIDLQKSGRMIGVISHVEELKNAMPAILEVVKEKEGYSKTRFIIK